MLSKREDLTLLLLRTKINKAIIVDVASPWDHRQYGKEGEKTDTNNSNNNNDYV